MSQPSSAFANESAHYDFTIVGAGASGLWLALAMAEEGLLDEHSLCIAESDAAKGNDRTWCFWSEEALVPAEMVSKSWAEMRKPHAPTERTHTGKYRYYHLRSTDFYSFMKDRLCHYPGITWVYDSVSNLSEEGNKVVLTSTGHQWTSGRVFVSATRGLHINGKEMQATLTDFLGQAQEKEDPLFLWQSFVGWRVNSRLPVFDESCATMMRFDVPQKGHTQFLYELPFSGNEALIELTRFGHSKLEPAEAEVELRKYMGDNTDFSIEEVEIAAIPMTPRFDMMRKKLTQDARIVFIGTAGGAIKPTTGYAFKRMQQYAYLLAKALKRETTLPTMHRHWRFRLYDRLLLQILQYRPERGKPVFIRLFSKLPLPRVFKFLDEETSIVEELSIFSKLPIPWFLRSLWQHLIRK